VKINYKSFKKALKDENYEDAFYILFRMIDNLDPDSVKADKEWTALIRSKKDDVVIKTLEKKIYSLPKKTRNDMELKYQKLLEE